MHASSFSWFIMPPSTRIPTRRAGMGVQSSLMSHLAGAEAFVRLSDQAARLGQLQKQLDATLPAHLLPGTRVANLKRGKVIIHAASGAVAVKLRQLAPRLAESFNQLGPEITSVEVRVQAHRSGIFGQRRVAAKVLGSRSRLALASLAEGIPVESPLRRALDGLLERTK